MKAQTLLNYLDDKITPENHLYSHMEKYSSSWGPINVAQLPISLEQVSQYDQC